MPIIHSSIDGVYLLDEQMNVIQKVAFGKNNEKAIALEKNEWLPEEKELIQKNNNQKIMYLGFKKEKIPGVIFTQDKNKLEKASQLIKKDELRTKSILLTKKKIKESFRNDALIIQTSNSIEDLAKSANLLAKRLREWYELCNPEFSKSIEDHEKFIELITKKNRHELLSSMGIDEAESMGAKIADSDLKEIIELAHQITRIYEVKERQTHYLEKLMEQECPNTKAIAGASIGAKLITLAGSMKRLSEMPASKIQVLGAEKALFRHIKTGARAPKYGILFNHPLLQKGEKSQWGKIGRTLADKIAIAAKVDYFKGKFIGDKIMAELEVKFK